MEKIGTRQGEAVTYFSYRWRVLNRLFEGFEDRNIAASFPIEVTHIAEKIYREARRKLLDGISFQDRSAVFAKLRDNVGVEDDSTPVEFINDNVEYCGDCYVMRVPTKYSDSPLSFIFRLKRSEDNFIAVYDDNGQKIILPYLPRTNTCFSRSVVEKFIANHGNIIHELVHFLDDKCGILSKNPELDKKKYYNSEEEIRARVSSLVLKIRSTILQSNDKTETLKRFLDDDYLSSYIDNIFENPFKTSKLANYDYDGAVFTDFWEELTEGNKEKIKSMVKEYLQKVIPNLTQENSKSDSAVEKFLITERTIQDIDLLY